MVVSECKSKAGLPVKQSSEELRDTIQQAANEILTFRPPGAPPVGNDTVAAAAQKPREDQNPWSGVRIDDYVNDIDHILNTMPEPEKSKEDEWFFKICECGYVTWKSKDINSMTGIIADLEQHKRDKHSERKAGESSGRGRQAFIDATRMVVIPEGMDNRTSVLHPARTLPGVLDHKAGIKAIYILYLMFNKPCTFHIVLFQCVNISWC